MWIIGGEEGEGVEGRSERDERENKILNLFIDCMKSIIFFWKKHACTF